MSFFLTLISATDTKRRALEAIPMVQKMLNGKMTEREYKKFLLDLYHIVWHFCPIMAAAASRCDDELMAVRYHLYRNIEEEKGHEAMVLNDLLAFGVDVCAVKALAPSHPAQAMISYNYHSSERRHPCCVLGMLYVLEVISSVYGGQAATAIAGGLGRSLADGFTFLDSHASMDVDHMANLRNLLETIEDPHAQEHVVEAVQMNFYLFQRVLDDGPACATNLMPLSAVRG